MYQVKVNNNFDFDIDLAEMNSENSNWISINENTFHLIRDHKTYLIIVEEIDVEQKKMQLKVNNNSYSVIIKDQFDLLLDKMGLSSIVNKQISEIKAPMPGLVLNILVEKNQSVKKGDNLIVLEAMKMENIIKSPVDGEISSVLVNMIEKIEKNQPLIKFK